MKYSINVADLTNLAQDWPIIMDFMLAPFITWDIVTAEKGQVDGIAVLVQDIPGDQWDAIFQILREGMGAFPGYKRNLLRIYESRTGRGWKRI